MSNARLSALQAQHRNASSSLRRIQAEALLVMARQDIERALNRVHYLTGIMPEVKVEKIADYEDGAESYSVTLSAVTSPEVKVTV